ncbi:hypothetical protein GOQ29_08845 [Clostridium sp. D2Q-14]|uniref:hypothetical protein n=1 Tax=Anaeromonas gelatinilytica TaxID=2683194 RepID=UPI00193B1E4F|nr:hypothetical protein [Anaeromonas gelatinilytica]MBS4535721.1 hypothetical protein [Anaeromonas gelatinilytica]
MEKYIEFLLREACPSIRYRIKKEITNQLSSNEKIQLQKEILEDSLVKRYVSLQESNGWINYDFHSEKGVETAVRVLCEKGIESNHLSISNMLKQLEEREETFDQGCLSNVGKILDQLNLGGSQLIKAVIFGYAGVEDKTFITEQIEEALNVFKYVINVSSIESITENYKGKLVFKSKAKWPSIYHLRLLAYTKSWRNIENINMIIDSIKRLIKLSPIPEIKGLYKSQVVSPGSFCMHDFNADMKRLDAKGWMMWFHRMELLARIGVIKSIPHLNLQLDYLKNMINEQNNIFHKKQSHYYFKKWGTYTGLVLEKDWRTKNRYLCDLIFRSIIIMYYSEKYVNKEVKYDL